MKNTRILFIVPPNITFEDFIAPPENVKTVVRGNRQYGAVITDIPLGILSLSAYVRKHTEASTALIDFNIVLNKVESFNYSSFKEFFREELLCYRQKLFEAPDIIGISTLFVSSYCSMLEIAECCRQIYPEAILIAGGGVPTNMYREIFQSGFDFNALSYGEGERPLVELVQAESRLQYLNESPYWITPEKVAAEATFQHDFIENLDEIPMLDYDLINFDDYGLNPTIQAYTGISNSSNAITLMTSRGCVHRCCFCSSHTIHGRKMRFQSLECVKQHLLMLKNRFNSRTIVFQDDHFLADKERALKIVAMLRELDLFAFFPNSLALYALDRAVLEALKSIGVNQLVLAVESGSERVLLEIMHKPLNLNIVARVANDCRELDIYSDLNILIGLPGETKKDIEDAITFLKTINANWFRINVATPLVGSEMFEVCRRNHYLKGDYLSCNYKKAIVETEDFSIDYIQEKAYLMNLELNFLENSDMRMGDYMAALKGFENAIRAKKDHAIAYFCASKALAHLGRHEQSEQYLTQAREIVRDSSTWKKYAELFSLPLIV